MSHTHLREKDLTVPTNKYLEMSDKAYSGSESLMGDRSSHQEKTGLNFRFDSRMAMLLGEQSVSNSVAAVFELIKNSYDADATQVSIVFHGHRESNNKFHLSRIEIKDNGVGMTFEDIRDKWMVVGTYTKERETRSPKFGRRVSGEKGIGRFATQRLASKVKLTSVPEDIPGRYTDHLGRRIVVIVDWEKYQPGTTFDQIDNEVHLVERTTEQSGLQITLEGLKDEWTKEQMKDLNERIGWLVLPPELAQETAQLFDVKIVTEGFALERLTVKPAFLKKAPFSIETSLKSNKLQYMIFEKGQLVRDSRHVGNTPIEFQGSCGDARFQLFFYPGDEPGNSRWTRYYKNVIGAGEFDDRLLKFCGLKIYNDGIRILPYGDQGNDWLGLNKRYAQRRASSFRNETVIGFIFLTRQTNPSIKETTTREGIIHNQSFKDLQELAIRSVTLLRSYYEEIKNIDKEEKKLNVPAAVAEDTQMIRAEVNRIQTIPEDLRDQLVHGLNRIDNRVAKLNQDYETESSRYVEEQQMTRNLASVGISTIAFTHEIVIPINKADKLLGKLINDLYKGIGEKDIELKILSEIQTHVSVLLHWASYVKAYAGYLSSQKILAPEEIDFKSFTDIVFSSFEGIFQQSGITFKNKAPAYLPKLWMNRADLQSVIVNLLTNSVKALQSVKDREKIIQLSFTDAQDNFNMRFSDNGIGIPASEAERIFEPLYSTYRGQEATPKGQGMGLTIVRDILDRYCGKILVDKPEFADGASMSVIIPWRELQAPQKTHQAYLDKSSEYK